jgi:hypothetical protein
VSDRPSARPRFSAPDLVGAAICLAAFAVCVGSWAPWFSISLFTVKANIGGLNSHLDGRYAMALGVVGLGLGAIVLLRPQRAAVRRGLAVVLALLGIGGVLMVWHQYVHLVHSATTVGRTSGLTPFAKYFDVHAGAAWGLWLTGGSFAALILAAGFVPAATRPSASGV